MNRFSCLHLLLLLSVASVAQSEFAVSKIPAHLLHDANVVKRKENKVFEITESNRANIRYTVAYTILNEQGEKWNGFYEEYDRFRSIESVEGNLYNANGDQIKKLKRSDIVDRSGGSDGLADDNRSKSHSFFYKVYPYTVEYEVQIRYKGTMFLPRWIPQESHTMSVQQSSLTVIAPIANPLHYKMYNYTGKPAMRDEKSNRHYSWEVKEIATQAEEYAAPAWRELTTSVYLATENFELEDYKGSNASWKEFGKFVYSLNRDRDVLPEDIRQKVHELTDGVSNVKEKISRLYKYMQDNTRYVSIQLGIGGFQPFDAKYVGAKKYGDCKALSNYMYALLKEAGIRSVYTLIWHGSGNNNYLLTDLPSSQFNHAILFVPDGNDTTWLECTSQTLSPGYLGSSTEDRLALAIEETGGSLVRTPRYSHTDNLQVRTIKAKMDRTGNLDASIQTRYQALKQDRLHSIVNGLSKDELLEYLKVEIELPSYDVKNFNYSVEKKDLPVIRESLELVADKYATITGKRVFIVPNLMTKAYGKLTEIADRKHELELGYEYSEMDSIEIELPNGYQPEVVPKDVSIGTKFGKYDCRIRLTGNKLTCYRSIERYRGRFPSKDYADFVKFYEAIYKADRNKVVLLKDDIELKGF